MSGRRSLVALLLLTAITHMSPPGANVEWSVAPTLDGLPVDVKKVVVDEVGKLGDLRRTMRNLGKVNNEWRDLTERVMWKVSTICVPLHRVEVGVRALTALAGRSLQRHHFAGLDRRVHHQRRSSTWHICPNVMSDLSQQRRIPRCLEHRRGAQSHVHSAAWPSHGVAHHRTGLHPYPTHCASPQLPSSSCDGTSPSFPLLTRSLRCEAGSRLSRRHRSPAPLT